jgi:large subunit ribosomal protein L18
VKKYKDKFSKRKTRIRAKLRKVGSKPRLSVFKSNKHIYVQIIDDKKRKTLAAVSDAEVSERMVGKSAKSAKSAKSENRKKDSKKMKQAHKVGQLLAKKALKKKIKEVYFDRGGYKYHGRVKALAQGARKGGLKL